MEILGQKYRDRYRMQMRLDVKRNEQERIRNGLDMSEIRGEGEGEHAAISMGRADGFRRLKRFLIALFNASKTQQTRYDSEKN